MPSPRPSKRDYYEILQVHPSADPEVIKAAYWKLAGKYHTDHSNSPDAHERMVEINEAYEHLSDVDKRTEYDRKRSEEKGGSSRGGVPVDP